ncbi:class F sortase [Klenkia brasiliensis]|uniref:Sortase family protein n=1 Tax=Klenkia brasiliensis TaxID=333142 RepID=A0A1G8A219_9ACTN|nr:class F sortase [Klenkia brasiliensis]SDH15015.1 Sortase family protein [Klenkia brasiliensis]
MRIGGPYPPPLVHVTRYERPRSRYATQGWTALSASLAAVGVGVLLLAPGSPAPLRQEVAASVPVSAPVAAPLAVPDAVRAEPDLPGPLLLAPSEPLAVRIPVLRTTADVVDLGLDDDGALETPDGAEPVGWYTGSPTPGALGPAVLAGHVDWAGEPGTFLGLRELLPGDQVEVQRADGSTAVFAVDRVTEHGKDDFPTEEVYGDTTTAQLRLITCGGAFDEDTGQYLDNVVVFASLVGVR